MRERENLPYTFILSNNVYIQSLLRPEINTTGFLFENNDFIIFFKTTKKFHDKLLIELLFLFQIGGDATGL